LLASPGPSAGSRVTLALRRASDGTLLRAIDTAPFACCDAIAFSPDGALVAVGAIANGDGVHIHSVADGSDVARLFPRSGGRVGALAFSPDGSWLVVAGDGGPPEIWGVADGFRGRAEAAAGTAAEALVLPGGGRVVTASDWDLVLWSPGDGLVTKRLGGHAGDVGSIASARDGRLLISAGFDETLRLWCRPTP
jgi:WD40 repeat protein